MAKKKKRKPKLRSKPPKKGVCDHDWTVRNVLMGNIICAVVICSKCKSFQAPLDPGKYLVQRVNE